MRKENGRGRRTITLPNELLDLFPAPGNEEDREAEEAARRARTRAASWCMERWREILEPAELEAVRMYLDGLTAAEAAAVAGTDERRLSETLARAALMLGEWRRSSPGRRMKALARSLSGAGRALREGKRRPDAAALLARPAVREVLALAARRFVLHPSTARKVSALARKAAREGVRALGAEERALLGEALERCGKALASGPLEGMVRSSRRALRALLEPDEAAVRKLAAELR